MNLIFVEDIYQAYIAGGNLHLMCANSTGETNAAGQDKLEITTKIVIPIEKAADLFPKILKVLPQQPGSPDASQAAVDASADSKESFGTALEFEIRANPIS